MRTSFIPATTVFDGPLYAATLGTTRHQIEKLVDVSEFWVLKYFVGKQAVQTQGYTFDNMIRTDVHSVSLQFVATSQIDIKSRQKTMLADARRAQAARKVAEFSVKWFSEHENGSKT